MKLFDDYVRLFVFRKKILAPKGSSTSSKSIVKSYATPNAILTNRLSFYGHY